jgi:SAM-dependent methyltransferase
MDRWKFFDITHRFHSLMNPMSESKVDHLMDLLNLDPGSRVIDVGCGKGEFLIRLSQKVNIQGLGIDLSRPARNAATERTARIVQNANIEYFEGESGGVIIAGEPFWTKEPSKWYLDISEMKAEDYGTHAKNIEIGEELGLRIMYSVASNLDDWDKYEGLQWFGVDHHIVTNPKDPDNDELLSKINKYRAAYIREGRDIFGWALYVFRKL